MNLSQGLRRFHVGDRLCEMTIHNGTVYLAGQVPDDATQDIRGQTAQVLASIDKLLDEAGSDNAHILMARSSRRHGRLRRHERRSGTTGSHRATRRRAPPCRRDLAKPEWKIEMVVTAAI